MVLNNTAAVDSAVPDTYVPTAADFGGGTGGTALWLAEQGLRSTLVEVSAVAIAVAEAEAAARGVELATVHHDLESGVPVDGRWDVVVCSNFLDRLMLAGLYDRVTAGGVVLVRIATVTNLERNSKPSRRFLVDRGELPGLLPGFATVSFTEGWCNGRHEARFVGRRAGVIAGREQPSGLGTIIWFGVALLLLAVMPNLVSHTAVVVLLILLYTCAPMNLISRHSCCSPTHRALPPPPFCPLLILRILHAVTVLDGFGVQRRRRRRPGRWVSSTASWQHSQFCCAFSG